MRLLPLIILVQFCFSGLVYSAQYAVDFYIAGVIGAGDMSEDPIGYKASAKQAANIYHALNIKTVGKNKLKRISVEDGEFECSEPIILNSQINANCVFVITKKLAKVSRNNDNTFDVTFYGELAEGLYSALPTITGAKMGVVTRGKENLQCYLFAISGTNSSRINCTLSRVQIGHQ
jgi:hypothetical protein